MATRLCARLLRLWQPPGVCACWQRRFLESHDGLMWVLHGRVRLFTGLVRGWQQCWCKGREREWAGWWETCKLLLNAPRRWGEPAHSPEKAAFFSSKTNDITQHHSTICTFPCLPTEQEDQEGLSPPAGEAGHGPGPCEGGRDPGRQACLADKSRQAPTLAPPGSRGCLGLRIGPPCSSLEENIRSPLCQFPKGLPLIPLAH